MESDGIELTGLTEVLDRLRELGKDVTKEISGAMYELAEEVMAASQVIVPLDNAILKNSKFVEPPKVEWDGVSVTFGYGGQAEAYAVIQHEVLWFKHQGMGEAKYLEKPLMEMQVDFTDKVASRIKDRLGL